MNLIFAGMRYGILLIYSLLAACQLGVRMDRLDRGRRQADYLLDHLENDSALAIYSSDPRVAAQVRSLGLALTERCGWSTRRGKFIDFYMHKEGDRNAVTYIYEYFLDCDSLRLLLTFNTQTDSIFLQATHVEPLESENPWLIDPMKSILKDKDWEKKK